MSVLAYVQQVQTPAFPWSAILTELTEAGYPLSFSTPGRPAPGGGTSGRPKKDGSPSKERSEVTTGFSLVVQTVEGPRTFRNESLVGLAADFIRLSAKRGLAAPGLKEGASDGAGGQVEGQGELDLI